MDSGIRPFEQHVNPTAVLLFTMGDDSAFQQVYGAAVRDLHRKPRIGEQCGVSREHLLPVAGALHRAKYRLEVGSDPPWTFLYVPLPVLLARTRVCREPCVLTSADPC